MFNRNKLKKIFYLEKDYNFWTYDDAYSFFHDVAKDLSYDDLNKLVEVMKVRLSLKKCLSKGEEKNV